MSGVKVNIEQLRAFEQPLVAMNGNYIEVLQAVKACKDAIGEGSGIEEAIERDGVALEKAFNEDVVPAAQTVLNTLATSAENAEEIMKVMASFDAVNTSAIGETQVQQGTRNAAFTRG